MRWDPDVAASSHGGDDEDTASQLGSSRNPSDRATVRARPAHLCSPKYRHHDTLSRDSRCLNIADVAGPNTIPLVSRRFASRPRLAARWAVPSVRLAPWGSSATWQRERLWSN